MRPDIPWNVAGIPPEAREAARAAARREGLSVGEWMTRRILHSFSDSSDDATAGRENWSGNGANYVTVSEAQPSRRDTEDMLAHVARSESESGEVFRRIEEQLRGVARRLEAAERSQSENNRAMSKAANDINIAAREQAQAFDQLGNSVIGLADRIDRVERVSAHDGLKDAVKGLHQGLSRLADQISATATQSATQISALADNLESVAARAGQTRSEADTAMRTFEQRFAQIDERVRGVERLAQANQESVQHALSGLDARGGDPVLERRLSGIERGLSELAGRFAGADEAGVAASDEHRHTAQRAQGSQASPRENVSRSRASPSDEADPVAAVQNVPHVVTGSGPSMPLPPPPAASFDATRFPDMAIPDNAPPFPASDERYSAGTDPISPPFGSAALGNAGIADEPMSSPEPLGDSFLLAARRSARTAAAQAELERGVRAGGFSWGMTPGSAASEPKQDSKRTYLWIAIIALLAIAAVGAGAILSQRLGSASRHPVGDLFNRDLGNTAGQLAPPPAEAPSPSGDSAAATTPPEMKTIVVPLGPSDGTTDAPGTDAASIGPSTAPAATTTKTPATVTPPAPHPAPAAAGGPPAHAAAGANAVPAIRPANTASLSPLDRLTALANAGNAKAELVVGLKYLDGDGVAVNEADAAKWLARAARQGQSVAQYRLGTIYERGRGVPADAAKAVHWYTLAAQAGNRKAMHNLAVAFASGTGAPKNLAEAARWFSKAASLGLSDSQFNLAVLYERGLGVPQSLLDAYKWYAIAAATGDSESKTRIDALATQLNADDRAAAQHSARAFHPQPLDVKANVAPLMSEVTG